MGKFEQEASKKVLAGEWILVKTRVSLKDFILLPFNALKNWNRRREIRKHMFDGR